MGKMMKTRDKKLICIIFMITMVIGSAILVYYPTGSMNEEKDSMAASARLKQSKNVAEEAEASKDSITLMSTDAIPTPSISPTPTPVPTPTPLPVYPLQEKGYPTKLEELVKTYYEAKVNCDIDTMKDISSVPDNVISKKQLLQLVEGIDDYKNIKCYVKKSYEEGSYIVFVYYDIKFIGLKTLAPSLSKLYIITDETGELKIFDGELTEELRSYVTARSEDEDVIALREHTDQLAAEAKEQDKDLKAFWEILDNY
jgi:hypothetical protein